MIHSNKIQEHSSTGTTPLNDRFRALTMTVPWNLFLLTIGALLFSYGVTAIAKPHGFVSGGIFGTAMLFSYLNDSLSIGGIYAAMNIPILILGWKYLSRRFLWYTLYSIAIASVASQLMPWNAGISDPTLAAVATGIICGAGASVALRSLGSDGGLTIVSLLLHNKYNFNVGMPPLVYNAVLFTAALPFIGVDNVLYSLIITYLTSALMNYSMGMFDQRKLIFIISEKHQTIAENILKQLGRGCTLLHARGAFTRQEREVLMTVVYNLQIRRVEDIVFQADPSAFVIIENTQRVLGKGFSQRKKY